MSHSTAHQNGHTNGSSAAAPESGIQKIAAKEAQSRPASARTVAGPLSIAPQVDARTLDVLESASSDMRSAIQTAFARLRVIRGAAISMTNRDGAFGALGEPSKGITLDDAESVALDIISEIAVVEAHLEICVDDAIRDLVRWANGFEDDYLYDRKRGAPPPSAIALAPESATHDDSKSVTLMREELRAYADAIGNTVDNIDQIVCEFRAKASDLETNDLAARLETQAASLRGELGAFRWAVREAKAVRK